MPGAVEDAAAGLEDPVEKAPGWVHIHTTECPPDCAKFGDVRSKRLATLNCISHDEFEMAVKDAFGAIDDDGNGVIEDSVPPCMSPRVI